MPLTEMDFENPLQAFISAIFWHHNVEEMFDSEEKHTINFSWFIIN